MSTNEDKQTMPASMRLMTVAELAEIAFHASERLTMLNMMNTPTDYEKRKQAFIQLAEANAAAVRAKADLDAAIRSGRD